MEKLIIFGDSIMRGVLLDEGKYICPSEERHAREETTGIEIESCCKFGATIDKAQAIVQRRIAKGGLPARCLIEFGGNDSNFDWAAVAAAPHGEHRCKTDPEDFVRKYSEIIARRRAGDLPLAGVLQPPRRARGAAQRLQRHAAARRFPRDAAEARRQNV